MDFMGIDSWILWGMVAVAFIIFEIFLPSFWMAMLSMGAVGASITAASGADIGVQLAVFSVISVISGVFFRPFAMKYIYRSSLEIPTNVDALLGKKVLVIQKISFGTPGKIKVGSEVWKAVVLKESDTFNDGDFVIISAIDGAKAIVKSSEPAE